jgi:hypothetical protein
VPTGQLVGWDRLVEYYDSGRESDRAIVVENVGPSTLGHPLPR